MVYTFRLEIQRKKIILKGIKWVGNVCGYKDQRIKARASPVIGDRK